MPTLRTVSQILKNAGHQRSEIVRARAGMRERNLPGYRIQTSRAERRVINVFHEGSGTKSALAAYAAALQEAGLVVKGHRGGLRVTSARNVADRGKS